MLFVVDVSSVLWFIFFNVITFFRISSCLSSCKILKIIFQLQSPKHLLLLRRSLSQIHAFSCFCLGWLAGWLLSRSAIWLLLSYFPWLSSWIWIHCLLNLMASCLWVSASFSLSACSNNLLRNYILRVNFLIPCMSANVFILNLTCDNTLDMEFEVEHNYSSRFLGHCSISFCHLVLQLLCCCSNSFPF